MTATLLPQILAYIFATVIAHFPIAWVVRRMWSSVGVDRSNEKSLRPQAWTAIMVGVVERGLYVAALQIGKPEFIGIWLAIKVAGNWKTWTHGLKLPDSGEIEGRTIQAIFLVGNALSVVYAALAWKATQWCLQEFLTVLIALFIATGLLWVIAYLYRPRGSSS